MLSHKMDFNCCANRDGFRKSSHIFKKSWSEGGVHPNPSNPLSLRFCKKDLFTFSTKLCGLKEQLMFKQIDNSTAIPMNTQQ